jgi:hypothetical protein
MNIILCNKHTCAHVQTCVCVCVCVCVCLRTHTCARACMHIYLQLIQFYEQISLYYLAVISFTIDKIT